jgi:hypothetical protein
MPTRTIAISVRARTIVCLLACCCAALAGCTTALASRPDATVKTPSVGKPPPPASAQAALSSEAFTPYAALGISSSDGLAPGESEYALAGPCMDAAGYPGVTATDGILPVAVRLTAGAGLSFTRPWGAWGYLGAADAQQYGFRAPLGTALTTLGIGALPANPPTVPAAESAAASKCFTIISDFANAVDSGPLAGIGTIGNDIDSDMQHDPAVQAATRAWAACMTKNGYSFGSPQTVFGQEMQAIYGNSHTISVNATVSTAANQAQLAAAVTDAGCTQSSDLAGIYFAVQASYEQQLVSANRQALAAVVSQYRAAYAKELKRLPALLRTTKARPFGTPRVRSAGA